MTTKGTAMEENDWYSEDWVSDITGMEIHEDPTSQARRHAFCMESGGHDFATYKSTGRPLMCSTCGFKPED